jgi:DivIVA domain-containing protein
VDRVRFSPALRGYRMDEVDDVVDRLVDELRRLEQEVAELRARRAPESSSAPGRYLPGDGWPDGYGDFRRPAPAASSPPARDDDGAGDR